MDTDTTTRRPLVVDTALADLNGSAARARRALDYNFDRLHDMVGDRRPSRKAPWPMSATQVEAAAAAILADPVLPVWQHRQTRTILDNIETARADLRRIAAEMAPLNAEFQANPWSRFFIVTSSNGHIHRDMACSTCRPSTTYGWLPTLSGLTEADAVADQGPLLCSVCFPTAPVAWTLGKPQPVGCEGSGYAPSAADPLLRRRTTYGTCPVCETRQIVTSAGRIRKHKPATGADQ